MDISVSQLGITIIIGSICGWIASKAKIPAGFMVGSIVGVSTLGILCNAAYMPNDTKTIVQIIAGAFVGCAIERKDLVRLPFVFKPAVFMLVGFLVVNMVGGLVIYSLGRIDLLTALMCVVPGGISDTPIIAADMGADGTKVAVLQLLRQILGIGVFPSLIFLYDAKFKSTTSKVHSEQANTTKRAKTQTKTYSALVLTFGVAAVFGVLGKMSGIPAGTFVFSIISVMCLKLIFNYSYAPRWAKKGAQILSGSFLGSTVTMASVTDLRHLILPALIIVVVYAAHCLIGGILIATTCNFSRKEAMLITTPAGASDMALISSDLGVNNTDIIILQVIRAVVVMTVFPQLIAVICYFAR